LKINHYFDGRWWGHIFNCHSFWGLSAYSGALLPPLGSASVTPAGEESVRPKRALRSSWGKERRGRGQEQKDYHFLCSWV